MNGFTCRFCGQALRQTFVDLGMSPLSNDYLDAAALGRSMLFHPLHAYVCARCRLVQLPAHASPETIFKDYAYFSSYSTTWLDHARAYVAMICQRRRLGPHSRVVEIASNDGYLLQYVQQRGIPVLGVEPAANVASEAIARGIPTLVRFFGAQAAADMVRDGGGADLVIANNVLAHVPDVNDFVRGIRLLLKPEGIATLEFPHLLCLIEGNQFDTIYHEHFSYFSLLTARAILEHHSLRVVDVEKLATHGGSLRLYACHREAPETTSPSVQRLIDEEIEHGLDGDDVYTRFGEQACAVKRQLLRFLIDARERRQTVVGYGAPAKGNTLLNFCGIRADLLAFTVDRSPHKIGRFLPGSQIPIYHPDRIREDKPQFVLILPWNLRDEIMDQMAYIRAWGGRFVVPIPRVEVV